MSNVSYAFARCLSKATTQDYFDLFCDSFGHNPKLTRSYLDWLYHENISGTVVGMDAFANGRLVAHYATIPRIYEHNGIRYKSLLSVNTATHPDHQRKGLFKELATATYKTAAEEGFAFVFGIANAQSTHGFIASLGFEFLGQVRLALLSGGWPTTASATKLVMDKQWLSWRLANPSATYFFTKTDKEKAKVYTKQNGVNFAIGEMKLDVAKNIFDRIPIRRSISGWLSMTPMSLSGRRSRILLPTRFQPSPWNMICLPLQTNLNPEVYANIAVNGLGMDTF